MMSGGHGGFSCLFEGRCSDLQRPGASQSGESPRGGPHYVFRTLLEPVARAAPVFQKIKHVRHLLLSIAIKIARAAEASAAAAESILPTWRGEKLDQV